MSFFTKAATSIYPHVCLMCDLFLFFLAVSLCGLGAAGITQHVTKCPPLS